MTDDIRQECIKLYRKTRDLYNNGFRHDNRRFSFLAPEWEVQDDHGEALIMDWFREIHPTHEIERTWPPGGTFSIFQVTTEDGEEQLITSLCPFTARQLEHMGDWCSDNFAHAFKGATLADMLNMYLEETLVISED